MDIKIAYLKRKARRNYQAYMYLFDQYNCDHSSFQSISSQGYKNASVFNETMDKLSKLDPDTPSSRL